MYVICGPAKSGATHRTPCGRSRTQPLSSRGKSVQGIASPVPPSGFGMNDSDACAKNHDTTYAVLWNRDAAVEALNERRIELALSLVELDEAAEHSPGTAAKYLGPSQVKGLGVGSLFRIARALGLEPVMWNVTGWDWKGKPSEYVEKKVRQQIRGGDVILLHDGSHAAFGADRSQTVVATDRLIARYKSEGYGFVTVPQMMGKSVFSSQPAVLS